MALSSERRRYYYVLSRVTTTTAWSSASPFLPLLLVLISFFGGLRCDVQLLNSDNPFGNLIHFDSVRPQEDEDERVIAENKEDRMLQTSQGARGGRRKASALKAR